MSSIELFRDTLLRVTTDAGCKVSRQNYPGSFYDRIHGKANKRRSVIGNVTSCYKLFKLWREKESLPRSQTENLVLLQVDLKITQNFKRGMIHVKFFQAIA